MAAPSPWLPSSLLATWFGSGLLPWAPGTWGSLAALPFGWLLFRFSGPFGLLAATAAIFVIGLWAARNYEQVVAVKDPGVIVIDEVAGQWLTIIAAGLSAKGLTLPGLALAFLLFRAFDVAKPWPVSWADRHLKGAFGIMADDIIAGLYAAAAVYALLWFWERVNV
jgi:phosphatidylglycerophosphatase A